MTGGVRNVYARDLTKLFTTDLQNALIIRLAQAHLTKREYNTQQGIKIIGRERVIEEIYTLLTEEKTTLLNLKGPPGVGKTEVAKKVREVAGERGYFKEAIFKPVADITDPSTLIAFIHTILHAKDRQQKLLLILDNCEQIKESWKILEQLNELFYTYPNLTLLTTSQATFGFCDYPIPPLDFPHANPKTLKELNGYEAVQLFLKAANAHKGTNKPNIFDLTEEYVLKVAALCRYLDGFPLLLVLAGSQVKYTSFEHVYDLAEKNKLPELPYLDDNAFHRTVNSLYEHCYSLLEPQQQTLFLRLGFFISDCHLSSAEYICNMGDLTNVEGSLIELSNRSLVVFSNGCVSMHSSLSMFAMDKLAESVTEEEINQLLRRFIRFYYNALLIKYLRYCGNMLCEGEHEHFTRFLSVEYPNLKYALNLAVTVRDASIRDEISLVDMVNNQERLELDTVWSMLARHTNWFFFDDGKKVIHVTHWEEFTDDERDLIFFANEVYNTVKTKVPFPFFQELTYFLYLSLEGQEGAHSFIAKKWPFLQPHNDDCPYRGLYNNAHRRTFTL